MREDCIFCEIVSGKIESDIIYEDSDYIVFSDIHPVASIHKLIVPKKHVDNLKSVTTDVWAKSAPVIQKIVGDLNLENFKIIVNNGDRLQMVKHLHIHLISGDNVSDKIN
jgi:histidine triad (HIT) family protein